MSDVISWKVSEQDRKLIQAIAARAVSMAASDDIKYDKLDAVMDITAAHANGCPLRLAELAATDDMNFGHDVYGIRRYINRSTGKIGGQFLPRFAVRQGE